MMKTTGPAPAAAPTPRERKRKAAPKSSTAGSSPVPKVRKIIKKEAEEDADSSPCPSPEPVTPKREKMEMGLMTPASSYGSAGQTKENLGDSNGVARKLFGNGEGEIKKEKGRGDIWDSGRGDTPEEAFLVHDKNSEENGMEDEEEEVYYGIEGFENIF